MKLSVAIAGENAAPSAFVVWRGFEESIRKAAEYGYDGVELALKTAGDVEPVKLARWLDRWKLEVSCISTGQVFAALGLYFTHPEEAARKRVIEVFKGLVELSKDFGRIINVGRARGFIPEGQTREAAERLFIGTAEAILEYAEKLGVTMIIEPVNRYEINFINSLDEGARLLSKLTHPNVGLMPDVFHMNIEDDRIGDSLARNAQYVGYIHMADSNRLAPGWGHLDFQDVFEGLRRARFDGWASVEILPEPDPDTAAKQAAAFLKPRIEEYNEARNAL